MRYPIKIASALKPLFSLFGFSSGGSYVDLEGGVVTFHFGTASETVPLRDVAAIARARWPLYYGIGPKLGPKGSVAYVGSAEGVVEVTFASPRPMNVWGPFRRGEARSVIVSLEDADGFVGAVQAALAAKAAPAD
jgi:hypothetical protein